MKRKLLIFSVLAICAALLAAGTIAFFNAEGKAHNVITTGGVGITVQEWADETRETPFEDLDGILPGMKVTKLAEIKNTGKAEAWIRVLVTKGIELAGDGEPDLSLLQLDLNTTDWTLGEDGYLYYNKPLPAGATTAPIFTTVDFSSSMGNAYQNATATVDVAAQGVQTANNGKTALAASGWPESN